MGDDHHNPPDGKSFLKLKILKFKKSFKQLLFAVYLQ